MAQLLSECSEKRIPQRIAARLMETSVSSVSLAFNMRSDKFSLDRLLLMFCRFGGDVDISLRMRDDRSPGKIYTRLG